MDQKKINAISSIQRAIGIIEGVATGLPEGAGQLAYTAAEMIEESLEVLLE